MDSPFTLEGEMPAHANKNLPLRVAGHRILSSNDEEREAEELADENSYHAKP
jgi:hypothetical protein